MKLADDVDVGGGSASMLSIHASIEDFAATPFRFTSSGIGIDSTTLR
jgi:hypothetical protein